MIKQFLAGAALCAALPVFAADAPSKAAPSVPASPLPRTTAGDVARVDADRNDASPASMAMIAAGLLAFAGLGLRRRRPR
jgi:MYXO-CTERM domain-containing protein